MRKETDTIKDLASILITNAVLHDDPRTNGATDCYLVSLYDIEELREALTPKAPDADAWLRIFAPSIKRGLEIAITGGYTVTVIGHPENGENDIRAIMFDRLAFVKPCPCGWWNNPMRECVCSPGAMLRHRQKKDYRKAIHSEIILDVPSPRAQDLTGNHSDREPLADVLVRAQRARDFADHTCMNRDAILDQDSDQLMRHAITRNGFTVDQVEAIKRVARTIADLDGSLACRVQHLAEAIMYQVTLKQFEV
jgi:hypothetical protein